MHDQLRRIVTHTHTHTHTNTQTVAYFCFLDIVDVGSKSIKRHSRGKMVQTRHKVPEDHGRKGQSDLTSRADTHRHTRTRTYTHTHTHTHTIVMVKGDCTND